MVAARNSLTLDVAGKHLEVATPRTQVGGSASLTRRLIAQSRWLISAMARAQDRSIVDGSLATAVSKLRKAMGDDDHPVIVTVPRVGYRLAVPVYCKTVAASSGPELGFKAGEVAPGREQWLYRKAARDV